MGKNGRKRGCGWGTSTKNRCRQGPACLSALSQSCQIFHRSGQPLKEPAYLNKVPTQTSCPRQIGPDSWRQPALSPQLLHAAKRTATCQNCAALSVHNGVGRSMQATGWCRRGFMFGVVFFFFFFVDWLFFLLVRQMEAPVSSMKVEVRRRSSRLPWS